jgi:putative Holliday junction resolvase
VAEALLALDVGQARIGVAGGRTGSALVFGRGVVPGRKQRAAIAEIRRLAEAEGARRVVVGLPTRHDGRDSPQTQRVRAFAVALEAAGLEVAFEDERFTSQLAERRLQSSAAGRSERRDKGRIDEAAAILILESYLARLGAEGAP